VEEVSAWNIQKIRKYVRYSDQCASKLMFSRFDTIEKRKRVSLYRISTVVGICSQIQTTKHKEPTGSLPCLDVPVATLVTTQT
jgi:hypothetical protein